MPTLYSFFDSIGESLHIVYCVALIIAVCKYKEINSTVICVVILCVMEQLMNWIAEPLLSLGSWEVWYGGWIALDMLMIFALYEVHKLLNVNLAKITNTIVIAQILTIAIQAFRYIERSFFGGVQYDTWYYLSINSVNISIAIIVVLTLIKQREEKRVGLYI